MKSTTTVLLINLLLLCYLLMSSCKKPEKGDSEIDNPSSINFLFNVPIIADTVFIDKKYNIDIRVDLIGRLIDSVKIIKNGNIIFECNTTIISSKHFYFYDNSEKVEFLISYRKHGNNNIEYFKSKPVFFKVVENLSDKYVQPSVENGKLKLVWPQLDKKNTQKYLVESWIIDNNFGLNWGEKKYYKKFEVSESVFIDEYYVGEEVDYKITVINKEGNKQDIWYYKKISETPDFSISQSPIGGYNIHFSQCKYYHNFGQYYLTDGMNAIPQYIHSTTQIKDTTFHVLDAKFGDEARFWIRYLPKQYPEGFLEEEWRIFGQYLFSRYGIASFSFNEIVALDNNTIVYTADRKAFKYNIADNLVTDSIVDKGAYYEFSRSTPDGKYIYACYHSRAPFLHFWSTDSFQDPVYKLYFDYIIPPVSNNLRTIMSEPNNSSSDKLSIYDITTGNIVYNTNYQGEVAISPDGNYFFINYSELRLCSYINNYFRVIWCESDWTKYYRLYSFDRLNNDLCYTWEDNNTFSIRKTSNFSVINSFPIELENIVYIDYHSGKIMGYVTDKILIYDLNNGNLIKEIPAKLGELFFWSNKTILLGNTIYNNNGIKYVLNL